MNPFSLSLRQIAAMLLLVALVCFGLSAVSEQYGPALAVGLFLLVSTLSAPAAGYQLGVAATAAVNTSTRTGDIVYLPLAAATKIFAGSLVARDAAGRAVPASDTAGLRVVGRAEETVDNSAGLADALSINLRLGVFKYANSATNAVDPDDVGKMAVVEDDQTVAETSTNKVCAGRILAVDSDGVWIDTRFAYFGPKALIVITSVQEATANGSDLATTQALANSLKAKYNTLQTEVAALATSLFG